MALSASPLLLLLLFLPPVFSSSDDETPPPPYLISPATYHRDFPRMLRRLRIYAYRPAEACNHTGCFPSSSATAVFHASLLRSPFLTLDPEEAHLFYLHFPSPRPRSISRSIRALRSKHPFWNRTLGADHFYLSEDGAGEPSDRNQLELRKNSIQVSPFPAHRGRFIPHKDLSLPSLAGHPQPIRLAGDPSFKFLAFYDGAAADPQASAVVEELRGYPEILVEPRRLDSAERAERMSFSRFCLFFYGAEPDPPLGAALAAGCVPVIVSGRPILDLPFVDVLRWPEMSLLVDLRGGAAEVRRAMQTACGDGYTRMRALAAEASLHFRWQPPEAAAVPRPPDAFLTVLYQLWRRRHTVRYARWDESEL